MDKTSLIIFCLTVLLSSCKERSNTEKKEFDIVSKPEIMVDEVYIRKDSLAHAWYTELLVLANSNSKFTLIKEPYPNDHYKEIIDTILTVIFKDSKIVIYKAQNKDILISARIKDVEFELNNSLKIGTGKNEIEKLLGIKISDDIFEVGDLEWGSVFTFTYVNDKLETIEFEGYID